MNDSRGLCRSHVPSLMLGILAELLRGGDEDSSRLLRALDRLVVTALQGDLHPVITEHIYSARLFPLKKKNGKARPVAVGDTFRRVIEKVALALPASKELLASLLPIQTGLSGNAICEQVPFPSRQFSPPTPAKGNGQSSRLIFGTRSTQYTDQPLSRPWGTMRATFSHGPSYPSNPQSST